MNSYITIGDYEFTHCHSFTTTKSWKQMTQTASIKMHNIAGLLGAIKVGDAVEIQGAYDDEYITEFKGYVSEILPTMPVEIKCEDEMWNLKQTTKSGSWKSITLKNLLKFLVPDATIDCPEVTLSPFRISENTTVAYALQKLKDDFLLTSYYREKTLFIGLPYIEKNLPEVVYHFQKNAKATGLIYKRKEDLRIKVKAVSVLPNNQRIEKEFGDSDGNSITLHFYNKQESELKALAQEQIDRMKYDGYKGTFRSLGGRPYVDHSWTLWLEDDYFPEREQGVFADMVVTNYGPEGYNRTITPGRKVLI
ncbi:hypothetical protein [Aurantibacillus circumpalustris]|uniref:hypothetical protein n=1 Tax=Aurantibacillus circumpalustris TaxID=3036359 RepID=UPI00295B975A|nr:hypothetical protein [Aurantibacillus circumpalustris]